MSTTIPYRDTTITQRQYVREQTQKMMLQRGKVKGLIPDIDAGTFLDLNCNDLGLHTWNTGPLIPGMNTWINVITPSNKIICLYKFLQLSANPVVTSMKIWHAHSTAGIHQLEHCYSGLPIISKLAEAMMDKTAKDVLNRLTGNSEHNVSPDLGSPMEGYFSEPYIFDPQTSMRIELEARTESDGDYLVLGGYMLEPKGLSVV